MARKLSALGKGSADVESKLDEFISRANNDLLDVSAFDASSREHQLQREVDELKDKLAIAEARGRGSSGWGKAAIAFVIGCGAMFAVTTLMPHDKAKEEPKAAVAPAPALAPTPAPQVTPIEQPVQQAAVPAPAPAPTPAPEPAHETVATAPTLEPASTPKPTPTKHARHASPAPTPAKNDPGPSPQPEKPAETKQAGSDTLYNPF